MDDYTLIELFCQVDDFCKVFEPEWQRMQVEHSTSERWWTTRERQLVLSEIMTIVIVFHRSKYRTFKDYYSHLVLKHLRHLFPGLVSYSRFISLMKEVIFPLFVFQKSLESATEGIAFVDSTILTVCHICRASSHKVFKNIAKKGKTTTGWFFGLKLHVVINHKGEIISWILSSGNVDDRKPVLELCKGLFGKVFGDKGYLSKTLFEKLYEDGVQLITRLKQNMRNMLMDTLDKALLFKRSLIETVINKLKIDCQIEHHRHRSPLNFLSNLIAGLASYCCDGNKPSLEGFIRKY